MTPAIHYLSDDRDKALAVMEDLHKVLAKFRIGVFARESGRLRIALSDPLVGAGTGDPMPRKGKTPSARRWVAEWRDFANVEMLHPDISWRVQTTRDLKPYEILCYVGQVMRHYDSAIIPAPIHGMPTMLLCDHEGQTDGRWRAYSLIAELDCYGYTERGIKPRVTQ